MTGRDTRPPAHIWTVAAPGEGSPTDTPLPSASVGGMSGLLEILVARGGRDDLPQLAHELTFEVDDLLPLVDAAQLLGLAEVDNADLQVTAEGRRFVAADILASKQIFAQEARERAPLVRAICKALGSTKDGNLGEGFFLDLLRRGFSEDEARQQLKIAIDWGRYGELFDFDANTGQFTLERPHHVEDR
jgi:NitT/TauT family transport system ATP-binding protein